MIKYHIFVIRQKPEQQQQQPAAMHPFHPPLPVLPVVLQAIKKNNIIIIAANMCCNFVQLIAISNVEEGRRSLRCSSNIIKYRQFLIKVYNLSSLSLSFFYSDLQGNNLTVIYETDFQRLTKLRML